jgi:hypothetical protein
MPQKYCDSCLIIAYDNVGEDGEEQDEFLDTFSGMAMMEDHLCERIEQRDLREHQNLFQIDCKCKDHK